MIPTLHTLPEKEWPTLHKLMLARRFPHVPTHYAEAKPHLQQATVLGLQGEGGLQAAFVFGPPQDGVAFFDAVCPKAQEGRWATRPLLQALFQRAFAHKPKGLALRCLWVQPHGSVALRAALAAGFQAVTPLRGNNEPPVLVITPTLVPKQFNVKKEM